MSTDHELEPDRPESLAEQMHRLREDVDLLRLTRADSPPRSGMPDASWQAMPPARAADAWTSLIEWVDDLVDRYALDEAIPLCWYAHGAMVEELHALHVAWLGAYSGRASQATERAFWHELLARTLGGSASGTGTGARPAPTAPTNPSPPPTHSAASERPTCTSTFRHARDGTAQRHSRRPDVGLPRTTGIPADVPTAYEGRSTSDRAFAGTPAGTLQRLPVAGGPRRAAANDRRWIMAELTCSSESVAENLMLFMKNRPELGRITHATATRYDDGDCTLVLRDNRGTPMFLSPRSGPDALVVLIAAGFAEAIAQAVLGHQLVRLRRTRDGTASLEQATSLPTTTAAR